MKTILLITFLLTIGIINLEIVLSPDPFVRLFPMTFYLLLVGFVVFIFIYLFIFNKKSSRLDYIQKLFLLMLLYAILTTVIFPNSIIFNLNISNQVSISNVHFFQSGFYAASIPLVFYTLFYFTKNDVNVNFLFYFFVSGYLFYLFSLVSYSLFFEFDKYLFLINTFSEFNRLDISSFTINPNIYSFNLTIGVYVLGFLWTTHKKFRLLYFFGAIFLFSIIFLTFSKTAILSMVAYVLIYVMLYILLTPKLKSKTRKIALFAFAVFVIINLFSIFNFDNILFLRVRFLLTESTEISYLGRLEIWRNALLMFRSGHLFFGYGFGLSNFFLATSFSPLDYNETYLNFHNGFLEILVSYGLIGTLLLTIAHWEYFKALINLTKRYWIAIPMWALIISFAIQMMFEDRILFRPDLSGIFFMTILILPIVKPAILSKKISDHIK
jgi:O-antigen ligase